MKDSHLHFRISTENKQRLEDKIKADGYSNTAEWFNELLRNYLKGVDKK